MSDFIANICKEVSGVADLQRPFQELRNAEAGKAALVVGNSPWRVGFDLAAWSGGPVIGCNALYRDFEPDYLCVYDTNMIDEVLRSEFIGRTKKTKVIFRATETKSLVLSAMAPETRAGWYAGDGHMPIGGLCGPFAIITAGWLGCHSVTLVGFSFDEGNIYQGTPNYSPEGRWEAYQLEPGGRPESIGRVEEAIRQYKVFVPDGYVHVIAPADWSLQRLEHLSMKVERGMSREDRFRARSRR